MAAPTPGDEVFAGLDAQAVADTTALLGRLHTGTLRAMAEVFAAQRAHAPGIAMPPWWLVFERLVVAELGARDSPASGEMAQRPEGA